MPCELTATAGVLLTSVRIFSMRHRSTLTAFLAVACITSPAAAQSAQRWSIQASGLYVAVFGSAYDGLNNGAGGELQVRVTPSLWSYGFGAQYSSHGLSDSPGNSIGLSGIFFEPRRVFDIGSAKIAPYVSARLAYLQQAADVNVINNRIGRATPGVSLSVAQLQTYTLSASGFQGNVGGGFLTKLSPRVNLDLGVTLGLIKFGDVTAKSGSQTSTFSGTSGTGQNIVARVGLAIGLGGGAKKAVAPVSRPSRK
jgi:hypothetical protein